MEEAEVLQKHKQELIIQHQKGQDAFEKQLSFISSGAIGLSLLLVEKLFPVKEEALAVKEKFVSLFIFGLTGMVLSLLLNLLSHPYSNSMIEKTIRDIDEGRFSGRLVNSRWQRVKKLNFI